MNIYWIIAAGMVAVVGSLFVFVRWRRRERKRNEVDLEELIGETCDIYDRLKSAGMWGPSGSNQVVAVEERVGFIYNGWRMRGGRPRYAYYKWPSFVHVSDKGWWCVLGVSEDASLKEVKSAYQNLSKKYHPDVAPDGCGDPVLFREVCLAYLDANIEWLGST